MASKKQKYLWLIFTGRYECGRHIAVYTSAARAKKAVKEINSQVENDIDDAFLQMIAVDIPRSGYWRYWIINGEEDSCSFCPGHMDDLRWPAYDMLDNGTTVIGACGLGWTKSAARNAARHRIKGNKHD